MFVKEFVLEKVWLNSYPEGMPTEIGALQFSSLAELFTQSCKKYADHRAVTSMGTSLTFSQLESKSRHLAAYFQQDLGLKPGDRVAIMLPNVLQYYVTLFAILRAGLVVVNVNPLYTKRELAHQLADSGAETIVIMANFAHVLEHAIPETAVKNIVVTELGDLFPWPKNLLVNAVVKYIKHMVPTWHIPEAKKFNDVLSQGVKLNLEPVAIEKEDIAFLQYTGGTTGRAKGAMLTHASMLSNAQQCITWARGVMREGAEVAVAPLPLYHIFSLTISCFTMLQLGGEVVLIANPRDIPGLVKELASTNYTMFVGLNTLYNALMANKKFRELDFSSLRLSIAGGMATQQKVADRWRQITGKNIVEGFGLTEASPVIAINPFTIDKFNHSVGLPVPSTEVDIRDGDNKSLPIGEVGELCVRGPQVMKGYWKNPHETEKVLDEDGWLRTGDMAKLDENGFIFLVDRKKDMVLVSGFNVYPNEVEEVIASCKGVLEAAVIGIPCAASGECVKAFVVKKDPELTKETVMAHCRENLTGYKRPRFLEFVDDLPKSPVGKILRRELREKELAK